MEMIFVGGGSSEDGIPTIMLTAKMVEQTLLELPIKMRQKFARPANPKLTHEEIGETELTILQCGMVVVACHDTGSNDGTCECYDGFVDAIGFAKHEMDLLRQVMTSVGYVPGTMRYVPVGYFAGVPGNNF